MTIEEYADLLQKNEKLNKTLADQKAQTELQELLHQRYQEELAGIRRSGSYRAARLLTAAPRNARGIAYKCGIMKNESQIRFPFMVSVVIAVYNTADYLAEMLESIIHQKKDLLKQYLVSNKESLYRPFAYEKLCEIILVDDGSTDGSEKICDRYAKKYSWMKVIHKVNEGVSSARNTGINLAQGKYITFPDSDDRLSDNVFERCLTFFEDHEEEVSCVTYPMRFFDGQTGDHWTTYRFYNGTRILNMLEEWDKPQYFTAASFFKTASVKGQIAFDTELINGEDIKFVHEIIFRESPCIGLISDCTYWYRRRSAGSASAIQQSRNTKKYYLPYLNGLLQWLLDQSKKYYGEIPKFIQFTVMGQLQWRMLSDRTGEIAKEIIGDAGFINYKETIIGLLKQIESEVILAQPHLYREQKYWACTKSHPDAEQIVLEENNISCYFDDHYCTDMASCYMELSFLKIQDNCLQIEGIFSALSADVENFLCVNDHRFALEETPIKNRNVYVLDEPALFVSAFKAKIPLGDYVGSVEVFFVSVMGSNEAIRSNVRVGKFFPVTRRFDNSYYSNENWAVTLKQNRLLLWDLSAGFFWEDFESAFVAQIRRASDFNSQGAEQELEIRRDALALKKQLKAGPIKKQIWIVSDRYSIADDNGEVLFSHITSLSIPDVQIFFVIDKYSPDFERLQKIGNVLEQDSYEHLVYHMAADCIISSQADEYIINPYWRKPEYANIFKDLLANKKFVFLQHGVIKDDLSKWLNRYNKNISGFICSAKKEADSIQEYPYYYEDKQIWLTGLPRYDKLYHAEKKHILIMPTWRKWLMQDYESADSDKDATRIQDDISETDFFKFYFSLLNNRQLLDFCEQQGYQLCFMPHLNLRARSKDLCKDKRVLVFDTDKKYSDAFAEADLLITDYSSTAMDFAYLRKPVIYAQFDKEKFFSGEHTYKQGYFDYETNGFGEVVYNMDNLINLIEQYILNECSLKTQYKERIDNFFAYNDKKNCERVYKKICHLTKSNHS